MLNAVRHMLTGFGQLVAHPAAFAILLMYAALWFFLDRGSLDWHAGATLATLFMTLVIQRAEHRDTQALQAKLDELLRVNTRARNEVAHLDEQEPEDIEKWRASETEG